MVNLVLKLKVENSEVTKLRIVQSMVSIKPWLRQVVLDILMALMGMTLILLTV